MHIFRDHCKRQRLSEPPRDDFLKLIVLQYFRIHDEETFKFNIRRKPLFTVTR